MIHFIEKEERKKEISRKILADLPEWFGLPDSTAEYVCCSAKMPFWADFEGDEALGFIALKENSPYTAEIYVMGVLKRWHRHGLGKKLFEALFEYAAEHGYSFLQVKTVEAGHYKEYDRTGMFYRSLGFREFECFPTLWDEWNPCQIFVMAVG